MSRRLSSVFALALPLLMASAADAQVFGTFTWQMQPYCNRITLQLTTTTTGFALTGFDDVCGGNPRSTASGQAVFNPDGSVSVNVTLITSPSGRTAGISGIVTPGTGSGTWTDSLGYAGNFVLGGNAGGLPTRPVTPRVLTVADNPSAAQDPCDVPTPPTLTLCGTTTTRWLNGGYGVDGLEIWRDQLNQVHIRGALGRPGGGSIATASDILFILPAHLRPKRSLVITIGTGPFAGAYQTGVAAIVIYAGDLPTAAVAGRVRLIAPSDTSHSTVFFGELIYSLDQ